MDDTLTRLRLDESAIAGFCKKWRVARFELFGSVLRDDFDDRSDIDVLVTFEPGVSKNLHDWLAMEDELASLVGRRVDIVERRLVESNPNWIRRRNILKSARTLYAAA